MLMRQLNGTLIPWNEEAMDEVRKLPDDKDLKVTIKVSDGVTDQQRKAIFVFCGKLAKAFNDAGIPRAVEIGPGYVIESGWNKDSVYKDIWCTLQTVTVGTDTVRRLEKKQVDEVYDVINRDIAAPRGIHIPFPRWEDLAT